MFRTSIFVITALSLLSPGALYAGQSHGQEKYQKYFTCKAKIGPKNLKGPDFKAEMKKCTVNPDNYN